MSRPTYTLTHLPASGDLAVLKQMHLEYYRFHFPVLEYKRLDKVASLSDSFYGDREGVFTTPSLFIHARFAFDPEEYVYERYGIDRKRQQVFKVSTAEMESLNLVPKPKDRIVFDGSNYDVIFTRPDEESYWGHTNYKFETIIVADVSNPNY